MSEPAVVKSKISMIRYLVTLKNGNEVKVIFNPKYAMHGVELLIGDEVVVSFLEGRDDVFGRILTPTDFKCDNESYFGEMPKGYEHLFIVRR